MVQKRTAVYCRVSTLREEQEGSFAAQREAFLRMIEGREELCLAGVYGDRGRSGTSIGARPGFQRMLRDCEAGKIDLILTKSISRFARSMRDCLAVVTRLRALGISVFFEREAINTLDGRSDLLLNVLAVIAEEESRSIGQNLRWAQRKRNAAGNPCQKAAYGYGRDPASGQWYVKEGEARRVRYAFQAASEGRCFREILHGLNAMEAAEGGGLVWSHARLVHLLTREAYRGDLLTNKTYCPSRARQVRNRGQRDQYYIEDHHPPLVDGLLFDRVEALLRERLLWSNRARFTPAQQRLLAGRGDGREA